MPGQRQVAEFERLRHHLGAVAEALALWSARVCGPLRQLDVVLCVCCYDDSMGRGLLEEALLALPSRGRTELRPVVARLDAVYRDRAVPGPGDAAARWWAVPS
jgi:hypothetical protein